MIGCVWQVSAWMVSLPQVLPKAVALPCLLLWTATLGWYQVDRWWSHTSSSLLVVIDQVLWWSRCPLSLLFNKYTTVHHLTAYLLSLTAWPFLGLSLLFTPEGEGRNTSKKQFHVSPAWWAMEFRLYRNMGDLGSCVTGKLTPAWVMTHEWCITGVLGRIYWQLYYWRDCLPPVIVYFHSHVERPFQSCESREPEWPPRNVSVKRNCLHSTCF